MCSTIVGVATISCFYFVTFLHRFSDLMEEWKLIAVNSWLSSTSIKLPKVFWGAIILEDVYLYTVPVAYYLLVDGVI
jgi:hypothetical protein